MADAAPDDVLKDLMKRALEELQPLRNRISKLMLREANPGAARLATDTRVRFLMKLMEMELSAIPAAPRGRLAFKEQETDWLRQQIIVLVELNKHLLDRYKWPPPCHAVLLHRAARCCRRRIAEPEDWWEIVFIAELSALVAQHPSMYKHLLLVGDDGVDTASISSRTYRRLSYWSMLFSLYIVSMFPQGYKFDKNRLIWKWASEGLTGADGWDNRLNWKWADRWYKNVSKAEKYFSELVDSEVIIQAANYGHKPAAEAEDCCWQVNPDMLQFLASESDDKGFVCTTRMLNSAAAAGGKSDSTEIPRRLSLHQTDPELPMLLKTMDLYYTRSLAVSGAVDRIPLARFIYLRVLDLEGWGNLEDEDLRQQICRRMLLLMYLSVRNTGVTRLPPEIKELRYLATLDVSHTKISELPPEACELPWLQTLDLRSTQVRQLPEQIVGFRWLQSLLVGGDGINPDETVANIPEVIVNSKYLRVLATVDLSEWSASSVEALGVQQSLEELAITWSFHQCADGRYQDALRSCIEKWKNLKSLTIHCGLGCSMEFLDYDGYFQSHKFLDSDGYFQSHKLLDSDSYFQSHKLEKFKITTGRFVTVPKWIKGLEQLSFLQITVCMLGTDDLKILGELPKLQWLVLGLDFLPGEAVVIRSEGFSQLRTFSVHCLVPWLTFGEKAMPKLTYLDLEIISSVPPNQEIVLSGISNLEKLGEVVLRYSECYSDSSSVKMTVEAVKKEVAKHRGPIKLVINGTQHYVQAEAVDEETARKTTTEIQSEIEIEGEIESKKIEGEIESKAQMP